MGKFSLTIKRMAAILLPGVALTAAPVYGAPPAASSGLARQLSASENVAVPVRIHSDNTAASVLSMTAPVEVVDNPSFIAAPVAPRAAAARSVSVEQLAGTYVQSFKSLVSSLPNGGCQTTISPVGTDSISITHFYKNMSPAIVVKAHVDAATGKITIPNQTVMNDASLGSLDLAYCTPTGAPDRTRQLEGQVNADGSISIDSWWGIYVMTGDNAGKFIVASYNLEFFRANGTMSFSQQETGRALKYAVHISQPLKNVVVVKNFYNSGLPLEIELNADRTATITRQTVRQQLVTTEVGSGIANWAIIKCLTFNSQTGNLETYANKFNTDKADDNRSIKWTDWSVMTDELATYAGHLVDACIKADFDLTYPTITATEFTGAGTEADPYRITSLDDLLLLADKVNNSEATGVVKAFAGKYFRLENDIDLSTVRFMPIGKDVSHRFAGTLDGNGHKITGLTIESTSGPAGLIGVADTTSVLKGITIVSPSITTRGDGCGALAGMTYGTIENCHVTSPVLKVSGIGNGALAGVAKNIRGCSVANPDITTYGTFTGGIVGEISGELSDSYVTEGVIISNGGDNSLVGGIAGNIYGATVSNCHVSVTIDAYSAQTMHTVGGIAGNCTGGNIRNSFFIGQLMAYGPYSVAGGIVGNLMGEISDCYSAGRVDNPSGTSIGGITGHVYSYQTEKDGPVIQSKLSRCYTSAYVSAQDYTADTHANVETGVRETLGVIDEGATPECTGVYYDSHITDFGSKHFRSSTDKLTAAAGPEGFNASAWTFTEGYYPRLKGIDTNENAYFSATALVMDSGSSLRKVQRDITLNLMGATTAGFYCRDVITDKGYYSELSGNKIKIGTKFGSDTLFVQNGNRLYYLDLHVSPAFCDGDGTVESPYLIKTKEELIRLAQITTSGQQLYPSTIFKLANDIDLEYSAEFTGICSDGALIDNRFKGTLDGDGHTIHHLSLNGIVWQEGKTPEESADGLGTLKKTGDGEKCTSHRALVGRLDETGIVRNVNIAADARLTLFASSAPLVGENYGTVDNCRNYADITAYSNNIGGIVGQNMKGGKILNCYNAGDILSSGQDIGGITGQCRGTVENCANAGDVIQRRLTVEKLVGFSFIGGISGNGNGAIIKNVVNAGTVMGAKKIGGITGSFPKISTTSTVGDGFNDMSGALNYGMVFSEDPAEIGAIGGNKGTEGTVTGVYWDSQILPLKANGNDDCAGMTGMPTASLVEGKAVDGLDVALWQFDEGIYPTLKQFAAEPRMDASRRIVVRFADGVNANDVTADAALTQLDGLTWRLAKGDIFKIEGNLLKAPGKVQNLAVDTLYAETQTIVKPIVIKTIPVVPLAGEGTESSPYLMTCADDWNNLSSYITEAADNLAGKFIKVTADMDFTGKEFKPLSAGGVTPLMAVLDGDGHKATGIERTTSETYQGAVCTLGESGKIANLTLEGTYSATGQYSAAFTGKCYGTIENCVNLMDVSSTKAFVAAFSAFAAKGSRFISCVNKARISGTYGNVAGVVAQTEAETYFEGCGNEGVICAEAKNYTGGIVANAKPSTFIDCYNSGQFKLSAPATTEYVGGIVALADGIANSKAYEFTGCRNMADIESKGSSAGIVATSNGSAGNSKMNITDCHNTGNVRSVATSSAKPVAGIIALYAPGSRISGCSNSGDISTLVCTTGDYAGGIAAQARTAPTATYPTTFVNCVNSGAIEAKRNAAAGIIANQGAYTTIDSCYNTGTIAGAAYVGGIAGQCGANQVKILNSWNTGKVTASQNRAGGIFGTSFTNTTVVVDNCWNSGDVSTTCTTGGVSTSVSAPSGFAIGGLAGIAAISFNNCHNTGTISGASQVGGLVGQSTKGKTAFHNCYNAGRIIADADTCGAIVGSLTALNSTGKAVVVHWDATNVAENTWYVKELVNSNHAAVGTGVSMAEMAKLEMGESWFSHDNYSLPMTEGYKECDAALVNSAAVVLTEPDIREHVTSSFKVGLPEGVTWSATAAVTFDGNDANVSPYTGEVTLTATKGEFSKEITLTLDSSSAIDEIDGAYSSSITDEVYYTLDGIRVDKPVSADGRVYIVIRTYADGTLRTFKFENR